MVARVWLRTRARGEDLTETCGDISRSWDDLEDHIEEIMKDNEELISNQYELLGAVMKKEDLPDKTTFSSIYGKVLINSTDLKSDRCKQSRPCINSHYTLSCDS